MTDQQHPKKAFWERLQAFVDDYITDYECRGDNGDYAPNEKEQALIEDCVAGLLHELDTEGFLASKDKEKQDKGDTAQDTPAITLWLVEPEPGQLAIRKFQTHGPTPAGKYTLYTRREKPLS